MSEFRQFTYTNTGTEIQFIQGFFNYMIALGATIEDSTGTPITDASVLFTDLTSANQPIFFVSFGHGKKWKMQRGYPCHQNTDQYFLWANAEGTGTRYTLWTGTSKGVTVEATRSWFIASLKVEGFYEAWIGSNTVTSISSAFACGCAIGTDISGAYSGYNIFGGTFAGTDFAANFATTLNYVCSAGNIDYINTSRFISGGAKVFETDVIKTCSQVSALSSIALPDGRNFFAIGANAMVELDAEDAS